MATLVKFVKRKFAGLQQATSLQNKEVDGAPKPGGGSESEVTTEGRDEVEQVQIKDEVETVAVADAESEEDEGRGQSQGDEEHHGRRQSGGVWEALRDSLLAQGQEKEDMTSKYRKEIADLRQALLKKEQDHQEEKLAYWKRTTSLEHELADLRRELAGRMEELRIVRKQALESEQFRHRAELRSSELHKQVKTLEKEVAHKSTEIDKVNTLWLLFQGNYEYMEGRLERAEAEALETMETNRELEGQVEALKRELNQKLVEGETEGTSEEDDEDGPGAEDTFELGLTPRSSLTGSVPPEGEMVDSSCSVPVPIIVESTFSLANAPLPQAPGIIPPPEVSRPGPPIICITLSSDDDSDLEAEGRPPLIRQQMVARMKTSSMPTRSPYLKIRMGSPARGPGTSANSMGNGVIPKPGSSGSTEAHAKMEMYSGSVAGDSNLGTSRRHRRRHRRRPRHFMDFALPPPLRPRRRIPITDMRLLSHGVDNSRPLFCRCGQDYRSKDSLMKHIRYFEGESMPCSHCHLSFRRLAQLTHHEKKAHSGRNPQTKTIAQVKIERLSRGDVNEEIKVKSNPMIKKALQLKSAKQEDYGSSSDDDSDKPQPNSNQMGDAAGQDDDDDIQFLEEVTNVVPVNIKTFTKAKGRARTFTCPRRSRQQRNDNGPSTSTPNRSPAKSEDIVTGPARHGGNVRTRPFRCGFCPKRFRLQVQLNLHYRANHVDTNESGVHSCPEGPSQPSQEN